MRTLIFTLIKIAVLIAIVIIFLFLFVDEKIENEKLKLRVYLLAEQVNELTAERDLMRKAYQDAIRQFLGEGKLTLPELETALPEKEIKYLIARQGKHPDATD